MYLSRVEIDRMNRRKLRDLTHLDAYHAWVEQSFPSEFETGIRTRKLWRIDRVQGRDYLIIVSPDKPDAIQLEKYGVAGSAQTIDYQPFLDRLQEGRRMRFRIVLNPVVSVMEPHTPERGVVKPHVSLPYQKAYFMERAVKYGFSVSEDEVMIVERGYEVLRKSGRPIRLVKAVYEGVLTITDMPSFLQLLTQGMGKKKAYGFGLMTVIPIGE